jgi:class 3 adenylate cyclase/pimeloyl-ACP methyl ester carboxylesterase
MALDIRYVRSGGVSVAYQVVGDADRDLVFVPDFCSNLVYAWESPYWRPFYERLARSFRLIVFDKRGTGLSDRGGAFPTLETRMEDLRAVMDAVGSARAVVFGSHEGCLMAALFAATYPEQTSALALFHPSLVEYLDPSYAESHLPQIRAGWGTQELSDQMLDEICPTLAASAEGRAWFANWLRVGASPAMGYELNRAFMETDMAEVYAAIRVPTLVLYREMPLSSVESIAVADRIRGARRTCVSGTDYWGVFLSPDVAEEIELLAAGSSTPPVPETILSTLLFTDIVGSSERAASLGDRAWRDLLAHHHAAVRREVARFRGREQDTAGDGFLVTFDGPGRAIACAHAVIAAVEPLGLELRVGIHTGECELHDGKPAGLALAVGARICAHAGTGQVLVSRTVKDLVAGSGFAFALAGEHDLKGIPERWPLYAVAPAGTFQRSPRG